MIGALAPIIYNQQDALKDEYEDFSIFSKQAPLFFDDDNHESSTGSGASGNLEEPK